MIRRTLQPYLLRDARLYPVLTLTGPRQSGKTTLARATLPKLAKNKTCKFDALSKLKFSIVVHFEILSSLMKRENHPDFSK